MINAERLPIFLKAINIQGFKSFADRVKLELGQGLSVIVGPNGSGKSNVADAVRWVLGEQSAKSLRGTKMEDIIFAGSSKRHPVGMAEVSLIFDNSTGLFPLDFREVTITRRVYRDGEGQFFINRAPCRLKDIQELFMDTGAGREGFSIIGQGRVEEILNSKAEDRRTFIEEAAGITKYRVRKKETLKKLEDAEHNVQRLEDIIQELEGQLEPLAQQAKVAEQGLALEAERQRLEVQFIVGDLTEVQQKRTNGTLEQKKLKNGQAQFMAELTKEDLDFQEQKIELKKFDEEVQSKQQAVYQSEQNINSLVNELKIRTERKGYTEEQITRLQEEKEELKKRQDELSENSKSLEGRQALLKYTIKHSKSELSTKEEKIKRVRLAHGVEDLENLKSDLFEALSEQTAFSNQLTAVRSHLTALEDQEGQLTKEKLKAVHDYEEINKIQDAQRKEFAEIEKKDCEMAENAKHLQADLGQRQQNLQARAEKLAELNRQVERLQARMQALKSLEESMEGYQRGVRAVIQAKQKGNPKCQGICGTVADILKVDRKYEIAIETALGAGLQNVIAETEKEAKESIAYLRSQQLGRATFLPLDVIKGGQFFPQKSVLQHKGYIGIAAGLVNYDDKYRPAVEFILGRILVAKDMEAATEIAKATDYRVRIVTLEGDQVNVGGSLTGGSLQRQNSHLLGRTREIEDLSQELKQLANDRNTIQLSYREDEKHLNDQRSLLEQLNSERLKLREQQAGFRASNENYRGQAERMAKNIKVLEIRLNELASEQESVLKRLQQETSLFEQAQVKAADLRLALTQREEEAKTAAEEADLLSEGITQDKVNLAKLEQELSQAQELLLQVQKSMADNDKLLGDKARALENLKQARSKSENEENLLQEQLATLKELQAQDLHNLVELRKDRENLSGQLLQLEQASQSKRSKLQEVEQKLHTNEVSMARWDTEWETGCQRLQEEFSLTWEKAQEFHIQIERGVLRLNLQEVKRKIADLGPINHAALEEYPKASERYQFLLAQKEDLVLANDKLRQLITELDKTMSERFQAGFQAVDEAFQEVFRELFGGGQAELRLVTPGNLLETGIEIIAQPPGKKPQWLSLLSGGERALTAIALLFALLRVKPSPFCLLDEIEASLDDANVQRFAEYIGRLSHSTQFIVISHRKGTMEAADVLYGITMEETGVSKLLSVQLSGQDNKPASA